MRFVRTFPIPPDHPFNRWKRASLPEVVFDDLKDNWTETDSDALVHPKSELLRALVERQGHLCAWVGEKLTAAKGRTSIM